MTRIPRIAAYFSLFAVSLTLASVAYLLSGPRSAHAGYMQYSTYWYVHDYDGYYTYVNQIVAWGNWSQNSQGWFVPMDYSELYANILNTGESFVGHYSDVIPQGALSQTTRQWNVANYSNTPLWDYVDWSWFSPNSVGAVEVCDGWCGDDDECLVKWDAQAYIGTNIAYQSDSVATLAEVGTQ